VGGEILLVAPDLRAPAHRIDPIVFVIPHGITVLLHRPSS
jgi:hypothetical protein